VETENIRALEKKKGRTGPPGALCYDGLGMTTDAGSTWRPCCQGELKQNQSPYEQPLFYSPPTESVFSHHPRGCQCWDSWFHGFFLALLSNQFLPLVSQLKRQ